MNAEQMWNKFVSKNQIMEMQYQSWAFGAAADELADLVLRGIKTGTASAYPIYEAENEALPKNGGKEGEGDGSLEYWRNVHDEFFSKEMAEIGKLFDEDMPVVCEEFELVFIP